MQQDDGRASAVTLSSDSFALRKPVFAKYIDLEDDLQYIKAMSTSLKKDDFHSKSNEN